MTSKGAVPESSAATGRVKGSGRVGEIVIHDPSDTDLTYKLRFSDGQDPSVDWFSANSVEVLAEVGSLSAIPSSVESFIAGVAEANAMAAPLRISGPLLKLSPHFLRGWQLRWFEVGGGSVRYYSSPDDAKAKSQPKREISLEGLNVQMKSDSAFDFTALCTGDRTFSLDANVGSYVGSAGWNLGPAGLATAKQWVAALEQEAAHHRERN